MSDAMEINTEAARRGKALGDRCLVKIKEGYPLADCLAEVVESGLSRLGYAIDHFQKHSPRKTAADEVEQWKLQQRKI